MSAMAPTSTPASLDRLFLDFSDKKLEQLMDRIKTAVERLSEEQVWARPADAANAIGNLLLHLNGNVRQWILAGIGGETDIRHRDAEFAATGDVSPADLMGRLDSTVSDARQVIRELSAARLTELVVVQNYERTVLESIYHVVEHFSAHTGQILYASKAMTNKGFDFYPLLGKPTKPTTVP